MITYESKTGKLILNNGRLQTIINKNIPLKYIDDKNNILYTKKYLEERMSNLGIPK